MSPIVLLDTQAWVRHVAQDASLKKRSVLSEIENAGAEGNVRLSAISI